MPDHIFEAKNLDNVVQSTKGTELMEALLLTQYQNSPNMKEFYGAFIAEMDLLFEHTERVYLGRFLEYAQGKQLDVLGDIVGISRAIALPTLYFGFQGASGIAGMADEATPNVGGVFLSEESQGFTITPLDDATYMRAIRAKAFLNTVETVDINSAYKAIHMLLGRVVSTLAFEAVATLEIRLTLSSSEVTQAEIALILYMSKYFITNTVVFNINQI